MLVLLVRMSDSGVDEVADINVTPPIYRKNCRCCTRRVWYDDVLDECDVRKVTINCLYGRVAVLAGDFLFAQSSWGLK